MLLTPTTQGDALAFSRYAYPPPYGIYTSPLGSEEVFCDPNLRYYSLHDGNSLAGFCCFGSEARVAGSPVGHEEPETVDVGIGLSPEWSGRGEGGKFLDVVIGHAAEALSPKFLRATIAAFNLRSLSVFERAKFVQSTTFIRPSDAQEFVILKRFCETGPAA